MKEIKIDLDAIASDEPKDFEISGKNYLQIEVKLPNGETISGSDYCVNITLSKDAMKGFALNLLKEALDPDLTSNQLRMWELFPSVPGGATEALGVYLHPKSCELKLFEGDDGPLNEVLNRKPI